MRKGDSVGPCKVWLYSPLLTVVINVSLKTIIYLEIFETK